MSLAANAPLHAATVQAAAGSAALLASVGPGSPIAAENYRAFLPALYAVANARPLERIWTPTRKVMKELNAALDGAGAGRFVAQSASRARTTFACPDGGTVNVSRTVGTAVVPSLSASFRRCGVDGQRLDGPVTLEKGNPALALFGTAGGPDRTRAFVHTDRGGLATSIDGYRSASRTGGGSDRGLTWSGDWGLRSGRRSLSVIGMQLDASNEAGGIFWKSGFEMSGDVTNGKRVPVATYETFATYGGPGFVRGYTQALVLDGAASAEGRMAIGATDDGTGEFGITMDTYAPEGTSTIEARIPQSAGGGPLKLGAR